MRASTRLPVAFLSLALSLGCGSSTKADEPKPGEKTEEKAPEGAPPADKPADRPADKPADKPVETKPLDSTPGSQGAPGPAPLQKPGENAGGLGTTKPGVPNKPLAPLAEGEKTDKADKDKGGAGARSRPVVQKDERVYVVKVTDRFKSPTFSILDAQLWVPEVSILGGEGGEEKKVVTIKHGAAEIEVPFADIASIEIKDVQEDRLPIVITFRAPDRAGKELDGTIKANLQLRGRYEKSDLRARLKVRELVRLDIEESKEGK